MKPATPQATIDDLPRYRQVADDLHKQIAGGKHKVGDLLPTELEICASYSVSRHTAREALRILSEIGLVERRQGHGTRVLASSPRAFQRDISSLSELLQYGVTSRLDVRIARKIAADKTVARLLDCKDGTRCTHVRAVRSDGDTGQPVCVSDFYRVATTDALTKSLTTLKGAVYAVMNELAFGPIGRVEQHISAGPLDGECAGLLQSRPGDPCLVIARRYFDLKDVMILSVISRHRSPEFVYSMELKRNV